jgi:hypothetical protein
LTSSLPAPPFDGWPIQRADPRFGFAWYVEPAVLITQATVEIGTVEAVMAVNDVIDHYVNTRVRDYRAHGGLLIVHDWRSLKGYETVGRQHMLERMKRREGSYLRGAVAVVPDTPMFRMAAQTVNLLMAFRPGGRLQMATDPEVVLRQHGIRPPMTSRVAV